MRTYPARKRGPKPDPKLVDQVLDLVCENKMTYQQIAVQTGVSMQTISRWVIQDKAKQNAHMGDDQ